MASSKASELRLPEAESLPDGFTEGDGGDSSKPGDCIACQLPQAESLPDGFTEVTSNCCKEGACSPRGGGEANALLSRLGIGSPSRGGGGEKIVVDEVAVSGEIGSCELLVADRAAERARKFPVPLSDAASGSENEAGNNVVAAMQEDSRESLSGLLLPEPVVAGSKTDTNAGKNRKRRVKEIKLMLEAPDKSASEKLQFLHSKCLQQLVENEALEKELATVRQKLAQESNERVALSVDLSKSTLLRQKLESLCRELQRQNKLLLDESKHIAAEEQRRREELSAKFHNTIKEISLKLDEQEDVRARQAKENEMLREKLKHFSEQYEIREEQFTHQLKTKALEHQLVEVKLKQQQELVLQEEAKSRTYAEQISQLLATEQDLRSQLALYGDKFEQFQDTLTKSNEVFSSFKQEMEKMSKTIKLLEKENISLKTKCQKSDVSLIELLEERAILKKQLDTTTNQKLKLEALCRILQAERKQQLQTTTTTITTSESISPEPTLQEAT